MEAVQIQQKNASKIYRISRLFRLFFFVLIPVIPLGLALFWLNLNSLTPFFKDLLPVEVTAPLPLWILFLGFAGSMISVSILIWGLFILVKLFRLYEQNKIFTVANVRCYRKLGYVAFIFVPAKVASNTCIGVVLTLTQEQQRLQISFSSNELSILIISGLILLISWVMEEGRKLQTEQDLVI